MLSSSSLSASAGIRCLTGEITGVRVPRLPPMILRGDPQINMDGRVIYVDQGQKFALLLTKDVPLLDRMTKRLQELYGDDDKHENDDDRGPFKELLCATKSSREEVWSRGCIVERLEGRIVKVLLLDRGSVEKKTLDELRPLLDADLLAVPPLALHVQTLNMDEECDPSLISLHDKHVCVLPMRTKVDEKQTTAQKSPPPLSRSGGSIGNRVMVLWDEGEAVRWSVGCQKCLLTKTDSVVLDCGHVCACYKFAGELRLCPDCRVREPIRRWKS